MSKKSLIILSTFFSILLVLVIVFFIIKQYDNKSFKNENLIVNETGENKRIGSDENSIITSNKEQEVVGPNAKLTIKTYYKKCGHYVQEEYVVPEEIVNMNEKEVEKYYFDWKLNKFSDKQIIIYKELAEMCNEHYIVKSVDGMINVYNKNESNEENLVYETKIFTKYLPKEDQAKLEEGINIIGKENLSSLIEDYE